MNKSSFLNAALLLAVSITGLQLQAQPQSNLPAFSMMLTNGKTYQTTQLSKSKPTVLIYFAPDCEHCQVLLKAFFQKITAFKNTEVLLVTFKPVADLVGFEKSYKTAKYPYLHVGAETAPLYLQRFFNLQKTPFTVLYNKAKNMIASYKDETPVEEIIRQLKNIK